MIKDERTLFSLFKVGISIHNLNKKAEQKIGLSLVQWCLLKQLIDMPGTSAVALAKSVGIHPSTLTQTLKRLEKKGFLFLAEDPKDSRRKLVSLTKSGKKTLERVDDQMQKWSSNLSSFASQMAQLNESLIRATAF